MPTKTHTLLNEDALEQKCYKLEAMYTEVHGRYTPMLEIVLRSWKEVSQMVQTTAQDLPLSASYCIPLLPC
jgi:hypothetical protein